ncbi:hypothetical protein SCAR479_13256 [Seiridium cardinale]|uniref:2EXR domain-containing protein n=1 Tax=Seiridium cardinale TaxID=138064 RepID=A0ABR2X8H6_9PEZI
MDSTEDAVPQGLHRFPRLPCELRLMIWKEHFLSLNRLIPYDMAGERVLPVRHMATPSINQESQAVFKHHYTICLSVKTNPYPLLGPFLDWCEAVRQSPAIHSTLTLLSEATTNTPNSKSRVYTNWARLNHSAYGDDGSYAPDEVEDHRKPIDRGTVYLDMDLDTFVLGPNFEQWEGSWSGDARCSVTLLNHHTSRLLPAMIKHILDVRADHQPESSNSILDRQLHCSMDSNFHNKQSCKHLGIKQGENRMPILIRMQNFISNLENASSGHDALEGEINSSYFNVFERDEEGVMRLGGCNTAETEEDNNKESDEGNGGNDNNKNNDEEEEDAIDNNDDDEEDHYVGDETDDGHDSFTN